MHHPPPWSHGTNGMCKRCFRAANGVPPRHSGNSCSQAPSHWGDFATWKVLRWLQAEGEQGLGISWGAGPAQCSGNTWSQLWGQEGIFP